MTKCAGFRLDRGLFGSLDKPKDINFNHKSHVGHHYSFLLVPRAQSFDNKVMADSWLFWSILQYRDKPDDHNFNHKSRRLPHFSVVLEPTFQSIDFQEYFTSKGEEDCRSVFNSQPGEGKMYRDWRKLKGISWSPCDLVAPVVRGLDNSIRWLNRYRVDNHTALSTG